MSEPLSADQAYERIIKAIERMEEEIPQLGEIYDAFKELMAQQAAFKAGLPSPEIPTLELDTQLYSQGVPLLDSGAFAPSWSSLQKAAARLIPAMERGFPKIREQLLILKEVMETTDRETAPLARVLASGTNEDLRQIAGELGVAPANLEFVVGQLKKPFAEKRSEAAPSVPESVEWVKGYCPVCGSWPELSFLEGQEGRRWLRCSFCGHEWQFMRTQCPFCETTDLEKMELLFQEDRPFERAELCYECRKYVVGVDLRDRPYEVVHEVAALGLVYLDILAQEKEFSPGAICAWNMVDGS